MKACRWITPPRSSFPCLTPSLWSRLYGSGSTDPEPADELAALTASIAAAWPETPPYDGAFGEIIPHLTVAQGASEQELRKMEADILSQLPIRTELTHACLYVFEAGRWRAEASVAFTAPR